jgi:DNA-binding NarL/FixJ family response regulator
MPPETIFQPCALSPALVVLLQACLDARTLKDKALAERLCLSPETIHTEFKRIAQVLGTHDRFGAVLLAWDRGWIRYAPPPPASEADGTDTP